MAATGFQLTSAQIDEFKREGVLLLRGFVPGPVLESWRQQAWVQLGADPADRATWPRSPPGGVALPNITGKLSPQLHEMPQFQKVIAQLGGGRFTGGDAMLKVIMPMAEPASEWREHHCHVDGYAGYWRGVGHHRLGATVYVDDVHDRGGCFCVWPGQHRAVHRLFLSRPELIDGRFEELHDFAPAQWASLLRLGPGTQFVGKAGDVMLWHGLMPHSASTNATGRPRLALISRWNDIRYTGPPIKMSWRGGRGSRGWSDVDDGMRRKRQFHLTSDLFGEWGEDVRRESAAGGDVHGGSAASHPEPASPPQGAVALSKL